MAIIKHIPNTITCFNLLSGCIASVAAFEGNYTVAAVFIALAALFDFADGLAARLLKAYSEIGKQLDSLADLISFGFAPSVLLFHFLRAQAGFIGGYAGEVIPYCAFLIAIFSGLRLAKFNIDTRQTSSFIGLPVPADALFWVGTVFLAEHYHLNIWLILVLIPFFAYLMVSEVPMFSLKFKNLSVKENFTRYFLLIVSATLLILMGIKGLSFAILLYIGLSLFPNKN